MKDDNANPYLSGSEEVAAFRDDGEEFSYSAVNPEEIAEEKIAAFYETEDEFSYASYADEAGELAKNRTGSYSGSIIEEFSTESTVSRVTGLLKIPEHIATYIFSAIYLAVGILCVSVTKKIIDILPYIVGGMMILIGTVRFILALKNREYRHTKTNRTATSLILTALGIMIIIQHLQPENESAITFISISWGILGLFEGAHAFNHAFKRIANSERCVYYLIKGIIEVVVAFLLLYDPGNHETHMVHIFIFGLNLIFDSITMLPQVKGFLANK